MRASFHISENDKGKRVVSVELAGTSEFDITMFKLLASMSHGGVNVGRDSLVVLFYERNGGLDGQAPDDNRPA